MSGPSKWACGVCTYLNFTATPRCTMCGGEKHGEVPRQVITTPPTSAEQKWECGLCTYLNYMCTLKCVQCNTPKSPSGLRSPLHSPPANRRRPLSSPSPIKRYNSPPTKGLSVSPRSPVTPENQKTRVKVESFSPLGAAEIREFSSHEHETSPKTPSPKTPSPLKYDTDYVATEVEADEDENPRKWECAVCTYENWPRAPRCAMCDTVPSVAPGRGSSVLNTPSPKSSASNPHTKVFLPCGSSETSVDSLNSRNNVYNTAICTQNLKSLIDPGGETKPQFSSVSLDEKTISTNFNLSYSSDNSSEMSVTPSKVDDKSETPSKDRREEGDKYVEDKNEDHSDGEAMEEQETTGACAAALETPLETLETALEGGEEEPVLDYASLTFLAACAGVLQNKAAPVEAYLAEGGDACRPLTAAHLRLLKRSSAFDEGHSLVHLAIRYGREALLHTLLSSLDNAHPPTPKRPPCCVSPALATVIRHSVRSALSPPDPSAPFPCCYLTQFATLALPAPLASLPPSPALSLLWAELLDTDAQQQLENDEVINWEAGLGNSRLYALWNRSAGDCLLDSVMQATWGVLDRDGSLREAVALTLTAAAPRLYPAWRDYELAQAGQLGYDVSEAQLCREWAALVGAAQQGGASLDQLHILALAHITRRPIVVYGVRAVKSWRGEEVGLERFQGVYLPLLWPRDVCSRSPLALGYTRGHFCALVAVEREGGACLPLVDSHGHRLPVHFAPAASHPLRQWLDVRALRSGVLVCRQTPHPTPPPVGRMLAAWFALYVGEIHGDRFPPELPAEQYSSDGEE